MLLNILECTRNSPTTENYLAQNVNRAEAEDPCPRPHESPTPGVYPPSPSPSLPFSSLLSLLSLLSFNKTALWPALREFTVREGISDHLGGTQKNDDKCSAGGCQGGQQRGHLWKGDGEVLSEWLANAKA